MKDCITRSVRKRGLKKKQCDMETDDDQVMYGWVEDSSSSVVA